MADIDPAPSLSAADSVAARARGKDLLENAPRAASAHYDTDSQRIVVELLNGATFAFPASLAQLLCDGSPEQLSNMELTPFGIGLHWPELDADYTVAGLMNGIFGTAKWMAQRAGRATSEKKAASSRENGKKGGRPRKQPQLP
jgi:hypothetical protein